MARSKWICNKKNAETVNKTPVVSTKSISKLHRGLVKKMEMKTLKYAEMAASLTAKIAVVEQEQIRNKKYQDRMGSLAQEIQIVADELVKQEVLEHNFPAA